MEEVWPQKKASIGSTRARIIVTTAYFGRIITVRVESFRGGYCTCFYMDVLNQDAHGMRIHPWWYQGAPLQGSGRWSIPRFNEKKHPGGAASARVDEGVAWKVRSICTIFAHLGVAWMTKKVAQKKIHESGKGVKGKLMTLSIYISV